MNRHFLDTSASTPEAPHVIYTADGSHPREIDDGAFVEPLDTDTEQYRVGVCLADTSKLYANGDIRLQAMKNIHAEYWDLPDGTIGYDPMIDPIAIKDLELTQGRLRNALIVSFVIGECVEPTDIQITFGKVEVAKNYTYKEFSGLIGENKPESRYGRVGGLILSHLRYRQGGDSSGRNKAGGEVPLNVSYRSWAHGARVNEAYMVAANHLVGRVLRDEGTPAIYRVHDLSNDMHGEFIEANCAMYQRTPGLHEGLGVDPYCRVTSPLRRLEDFIMNYHLRLRYAGKQPTKADLNTMEAAIRALNKRAIFESVAASQGAKEKAARIKAMNDAALKRLSQSA